MAPDPSLSEPAVIAIDPGSDKCGIAVVSQSGAVRYRAIVARGDLAATLLELIERYRPLHVLCGRGTGSKPILRELAAACPAQPITPVDESYTSEAARRRYVAENPPRGLERLLPSSLRTPSVPYDDYVAVILGEQYWEALGNRE